MDFGKLIKETTRPGLSYVLAGAFVAAFFKGLIPAEAFCSVAVTVIIWWFKSRDTEKEIDRLTKP